MSSPVSFIQTLILNLVQRGLFLSDEDAAAAWRALLIEIGRQTKSGSTSTDTYETLKVAMDTTEDPYGDGVTSRKRDGAELARLSRAMLATGLPIWSVANRLGVSESTLRRWLFSQRPRRRQPRPLSTKGGAK
jgi:hypothetical protein